MVKNVKTESNKRLGERIKYSVAKFKRGFLVCLEEIDGLDP